MRTMKYDLRLLIPLLAVFFLGAIASAITATHLQKSKPAQQADENGESCGFAEKIFISENDLRYLIYCNDRVYLGKYLTESVENYQLLDSKLSFPDLFEYNKLPVIKLSGIFPKNKPQFITINGLYDTGLSSHESLAIYKLTDSGAIQVFKNGLSDVSGRWTGFEFSETIPEFSIKGDLGALACGGCRIEWEDYYLWDEKLNTFELNNTSHLTDFRELLKKYSAYSMDGASVESQQTVSRAKQTIEKILNGENITYRVP